MATIKTDLICNLNQPVNVTYLHGNLFSQDNAGNTINVFVMDNGEPATIGGTVSANVIRSDGQTVAVSGAIEGNKAYVILPQACYAVPGVVHIIIKLTQNTTITTIAAIVANVYMSTTDSVIDPGTVIPSIQALMALIEEAVDSIPTDYTGLLHTIAADYSSSKTYKVGDYAWESGVLKRCIVPITAAETYTAAHWTNAVIGDDLTNLKSAFDDTNDIIKTYLVESNLLYKKSSFSVGGAGLDYQKKTFYILERTFTAGDRYSFTAQSITGNTNTSSPFRAKFLAGTTQIREQTNASNVQVEVLASDISSGLTKIEFYVYASTSTAQTQECVVTNPAVFIGYANSESFSYSEQFSQEVNNIIDERPKDQTTGTLTLGSLVDGFVNSSDGSLVSATSYKRTGYTHIKAKKIKVVATTAVANVGFAFYDSQKIHCGGSDFGGSSASIGSSVEINVPENAEWFVYSAANANASLMQIDFDTVADAVSLLVDNPCFYNGSSECRVFKKILCIGDSLTDGQFDYKESGVTKEFNDRNYAYPAYLKALTGRDITNVGDAGETTVSWYSIHQDDDLTGHDACIIALGRNDYAGNNWDNISSAQRIQALTNIITKVRTDNPQIKIFLSTQINYYKNLPSPGGTRCEVVNEDIRTAATNNNCYILDISEYGKLILSKDAYSHCTAVGYYELAEYYFNYISYIMHMNYSQFKTVQFTGTNRSYS